MEANKKNFRIADTILTLLAEENCTVAQASEILAFVSAELRATSTVQFSKGDLIQRANAID